VGENRETRRKKKRGKAEKATTDCTDSEITQIREERRRERENERSSVLRSGSSTEALSPDEEAPNGKPVTPLPFLLHTLSSSG
jgi:hypothetical protein